MYEFDPGTYTSLLTKPAPTPLLVTTDSLALTTFNNQPYTQKTLDPKEKLETIKGKLEDAYQDCIRPNTREPYYRERILSRTERDRYSTRYVHLNNMEDLVNDFESVTTQLVSDHQLSEILSRVIYPYDKDKLAGVPRDILLTLSDFVCVIKFLDYEVFHPISLPFRSNELLRKFTREHPYYNSRWEEYGHDKIINDQINYKKNKLF